MLKYSTLKVYNSW